MILYNIRLNKLRHEPYEEYRERTKDYASYLMNNNQDYFNVLRKIKSKPKSTQRELAKELGFSLGKFNYCIKALQQKGFIKIKNFYYFK